MIYGSQVRALRSPHRLKVSEGCHRSRSAFGRLAAVPLVTCLLQMLSRLGNLLDILALLFVYSI